MVRDYAPYAALFLVPKLQLGNADWMSSVNEVRIPNEDIGNEIGIPQSIPHHL